MKDTKKQKEIGEFLVKYQKYRELFCEKIVLWLLTLQLYNCNFLMDLYFSVLLTNCNYAFNSFYSLSTLLMKVCDIINVMIK